MSRNDDFITKMDTDLEERMIEIRRHLHRNPELSNDEKETQLFLRTVLENSGIGDVRSVAGHGLAIDITGRAGPSNRKVVIRADIDALPIHELSGVPYSSEKAGIMHACGHDAHAAMAYATAILLDRQKDAFSGTVRIIFQPAEEAEPLGGRRVVEEGLLDDVDAAIGIHVDPYTPTGTIAVGSGPYTLACDTFDATIKGTSAHAARPFEGVDALAVGCSIVSEIQKIVSREIDPYDPLVISVTGFEAGGAYNVIASEAKLKGTIRSGNDATRTLAAQRLQRIIEGISTSHNCQSEFTFHRGEPAVINDPDLVNIVMNCSTRHLGQENTLNAPGWTAADDFAFYSQKRPGVYFRLGIRNEAIGSIYPLHHPQFCIDEAALKNGVTVLCASAREFLQPRS